MAKKTLAEAAKEILESPVLNEAAVDHLQWDATHNQEPMHHSNSVDDPSSATVDLGGATNENPDGGPVGVITAKYRGQMLAPKGPSVSGEKMHALPSDNTGRSMKSPAEIDGVYDTIETRPPMGTDRGAAPTAPGTEESEPDVREEIELARAARLDSIRAMMREMSVEEDLNALFGGVELTEEFKNKTKTVFEAAVISRAMVVVEQLEQEILEASEQAVEEIREELENNVDAYLDHMVNEWMTKNEVAIESGLKTELAEEFIEDLRRVFLNHNINIPEEKVDVVEELAARVEQLEAQLNESINTNVELNKEINEAKKAALMDTVCEGLTATQAEKFRTLAESVEFITEDEYVEKLGVIKSQYFSAVNNNKKVLTQNPVLLGESADPSPVEGEIINDPVVASAVAALDRTFKK